LQDTIFWIAAGIVIPCAVGSLACVVLFLAKLCHRAAEGTLVFLLYQKGRDPRIFQAQDRAIDNFTLKGICAGII
jgi:hypothetical protein